MRLRCIVAAAAIFISLPFASSAQNAPAPSAASNASPDAQALDKVAVPLWPITTVPLPEQPVAASFALGQIEGVPPKLIAGVTAKGYARKVAVEDQAIGQILVVAVAKGNREETISAEGLQAQFNAKEISELFPEKIVQVEGSKAALIAALERLAAVEKDDEEKKTVKDDVSENPTSAGTKPSNDEAASYRTPSIAAAPPEEREPVVDVRTSFDGCPVRIDLAQGKAIRQSKEQTFTDGALSGEGQCTDSEVSFQLKKSFVACPNDVVDLKAMTAWPQFQWYYIDEAGENHPVGECVKDEETPYAITEDEDQCPVFLDFATGQAVPQSALVYIGRNNALTQVPGRGCDTSTKSAAVPMTESAANCPLRHDFGAGLTHELSMWTYVRGGVTYQAAPCTDNGRTFVHETVYADASGNYVCTPITNLDARTVTLQSRRRITIDGVPQFITDCTPDTSAQAILATTDGCMDPSKWTHDLAAGVSYGQERFYYLKANGSREYITPCQNSGTTYAHSHTITGYQHNDGQLWSYPLTTVTISVNGSPYTVASSQVLPGAPQMSYVLEDISDHPTGKSAYEGCKAYRETAKFERWKRPDDTEYLKQIGVGTPEGPVDVCVDTVIKSGEVNLSNWCRRGTEPSVDGGTLLRAEFGQNFHLINKIQRKNTETGEIVSTVCSEQSMRNGGQVGFSSFLATCMGGPLMPSEYILSWDIGFNGGTRDVRSSNMQWQGYSAAYPNGACPAGF